MRNWLSKSAVTATALGLFTGLACAHPGGTVTLPLQTSASILGQAKLIGPQATSSTIRLTIGLKLHNVAQLKAFLNELQNPESAQYHNFLTPAQFTARYGPTPTEVAAVVQFLKTQGIAVRDVSPNRILVHTQGTTGAYEHALGIRINDYTLAGRRFFSTADAPKLPAAIASHVQSVIGLNNAVRAHPNYSRLKSHGTNAGKMIFPAAPPATSLSYYNPKQIATAYDWPAITDTSNGAGVTTAIVTAASSDLSRNDYGTFWSELGLPGHVVNVIKVDGDRGATYGTFETVIDIEWSGAMGPGEALNVYIGADSSFQTLIDAYNQVVTDNTAQVMSTSWSGAEVAWGESLADTANDIFMQATAQGISMFAASGDYGAPDCAPPPGYCPPGDDNAGFPSSSPYVTSANGTHLQLADLDGAYGSETAWCISAYLCTGGATSRFFVEPDWQTGPGVPDNGWRNNSDMAMHAGGVALLIYFQGQWVGPGGGYVGTSFVAPELAGLFAIGVSMNGGDSLGQANALLYNDINAGNYANDFRDVTSGNNLTYEATENWDHPTGWGSPRAANLLAHIVGGGGNTCPTGYSEYDGNVSAHHIAQIVSYQAPAGQQNAILTGPAGVRLYARAVVGGQQKTYRIPGNEIHRHTPAGTFTWGAKAGNNGGDYMFCVKHP